MLTYYTQWVGITLVDRRNSGGWFFILFAGWTCRVGIIPHGRGFLAYTRCGCRVTRRGFGQLWSWIRRCRIGGWCNCLLLTKMSYSRRGIIYITLIYLTYLFLMTKSITCAKTIIIATISRSLLSTVSFTSSNMRLSIICYYNNYIFMKDFPSTVG